MITASNRRLWYPDYGRGHFGILSMPGLYDNAPTTPSTEESRIASTVIDHKRTEALCKMFI
jgi:hypothetical protein